MDISDEDFENMTDEDRMIYYNAKFQKMDRLTGGALTQTTPFIQNWKCTYGIQSGRNQRKKKHEINRILTLFTVDSIGIQNWKCTYGIEQRDDWMKTNFPTKRVKQLNRKEKYK